MSNSTLYQIPPNPEKMVLPPGFPANPPAAVDLILPDGYVFGTNREYPIASGSSTRLNDVFADYEDSFVDPFQPQIVVTEIDMAQAIISGVELYMKNYRILCGAGIRRETDSRTVASVLDLDFDIANKRIVQLLEAGALVGPYLLMRPDIKPFYSCGVGIWQSDQTT